MDLEQLLNRRADLSTFLIHLTRSANGHSALENLKLILAKGRLEARSVLGAAKDREIEKGDPSQRVVCFSEAPIEHAWTLCEQIAGRSVMLEPYGVVFTKAFGRRRGANPIWYTDITPGHDWLMKSINGLVDYSLTQPSTSPSREILRLSPFIEQMGPTNAGTQKEFWWEREWRHVDDFTFSLGSLMAVLAPASEHSDVVHTINEHAGAGRRPPVIDPRWSPERMIAALSGLTSDAGAIPDLPGA